MLNGDLPDDATIELLLAGHHDRVESGDLVAAFAEEVRFAVSGPAPEPSPELAAVFVSGFAAEKGDRSATAGSNVHGSAEQVAGVPSWRRGRIMSKRRFLSGAAARLAGLGVAAKVALGVSVAAASVATVGAGGMIAGDEAAGQDPVHLVREAADPVVPVLDALPAPPAAPAPAPAVAPPAAVTEAVTGAVQNAAGTASKAVSGARNLAGSPAPGVPSLPSVPGGTQVPSCVTELMNAVRNNPSSLPPNFASRLSSCLSSVNPPTGGGGGGGGTGGLDVSRCISSIMSLITRAMTGQATDAAGFDLSGCLPFDLSNCISAATNASTDPQAVTAACVPFNLSGCLSSIMSMVSKLATAPTSVPQIDFSACIPSFGSSGGSGSGPAASGGSGSTGQSGSPYDWRTWYQAGSNYGR